MSDFRPAAMWGDSLPRESRSGSTLTRWHTAGVDAGDSGRLRWCAEDRADPPGGTLVAGGSAPDGGIGSRRRATGVGGASPAACGRRVLGREPWETGWCAQATEDGDRRGGRRGVPGNREAASWPGAGRDTGGEFDPGSGSTLAACLMHASRTGSPSGDGRGGRVRNTWASCPEAGGSHRKRWVIPYRAASRVGDVGKGATRLGRRLRPISWTGG